MITINPILYIITIFLLIAVAGIAIALIVGEIIEEWRNSDD